MNGDTQEVLLRRRLGELAGFARTTPRKLPSASALRPTPAIRQPPTPWRAALLIGSAAAVIGGLVVLSQRERPIVPTNSTGSATAPEQSTASTAPGSVPSPSTTYVAVDPGTTAVTTTSLPSDFAGLEGSPLTYQARREDTVALLGYQLCVGGVSLAAVNAWPDGLRHQLSEGEQIVVPSGACVRGEALPGQAGLVPNSVAVAGDGGSGIAAALLAVGLPVTDSSKVSSGLARPDFYDWSSEMATMVATLPSGTPVVFDVGSNDGQAITPADGGPSLLLGSPEWTSEYMSRVRHIAKIVIGSGHPLIWVGVHDSANADFSRALVSVADATEYALEGTQGAIYILAWDVLRGSDGSSSSEPVNDSDGNPVVVRVSDGYHLTDDGARLVSDRVLFALRANGFNL